jgi:hypothetical protein
MNQSIREEIEKIIEKAVFGKQERSSNGIALEILSLLHSTLKKRMKEIDSDFVGYNSGTDYDNGYKGGFKQGLSTAQQIIDEVMK